MKFTTIYNPTQGLIRDIVESAMQKFTNVNSETVARALIALAAALADPSVEKVRVLAHSQGSIVMGDVLDMLLRRGRSHRILPAHQHERAGRD